MFVRSLRASIADCGNNNSCPKLFSEMCDGNWVPCMWEQPGRAKEFCLARCVMLKSAGDVCCVHSVMCALYRLNVNGWNHCDVCSGFSLLFYFTSLHVYMIVYISIDCFVDVAWMRHCFGWYVKCFTDQVWCFDFHIFISNNLTFLDNLLWK